MKKEGAVGRKGGKVLNCKEIVCILLYATKMLFYIINYFEVMIGKEKITCVITSYGPATQDLGLI